MYVFTVGHWTLGNKLVCSLLRRSTYHDPNWTQLSLILVVKLNLMVLPHLIWHDFGVLYIQLKFVSDVAENLHVYLLILLEDKNLSANFTNNSFIPVLKTFLEPLEWAFCVDISIGIEIFKVWCCHLPTKIPTWEIEYYL